MTLEQIVATHPCPIIRGKIMENVIEPPYIGKIEDLEDVMVVAMRYWGDTKEGLDFWSAASNRITDTYSDLKHLDKSCVPEPAQPLPVWRKIDKENLPNGKVAAIDYGNDNNVYYGTLELDYDGERVRLELSANTYVYRFTHYIPLSELINLPIED